MSVDMQNKIKMQKQTVFCDQTTKVFKIRHIVVLKKEVISAVCGEMLNFEEKVSL